MTVRFIDEGSKLNVEIHLRPITPTNMIKRPEIVWRTKTKKQVVRSVYLPKVFMGYNEKDGSSIFAYPKMVCPKCEGKIQLEQPCPLCKGVGTLGYFTNYERAEVDEDGTPVSSGDKMSYEVKEGGAEAEFPIFSANDTMVVRMKIPKSKLDELYTESWAEIEATMKTVKKEKIHDAYTESELFRYAEELVAKNEVAVGTNFVKARGFQIWNFVAYPTIFKDGTFGFLIGYWQAKKQQTIKRPIPKAVSVAEEQKIPTRSYLPDIEALLK